MKIFGLEIRKIPKIREIHVTLNEGKLTTVEQFGEGWEFSELGFCKIELQQDWKELQQILGDNDAYKIYHILKYFYRNYCEFKLIDKRTINAN